LQSREAGSSAKAIKACFDALISRRREQVEKGVPLNLLPIGAAVDSVSARAAALHAEHLVLEAGEVLEPLEATQACGNHILIFLRGKFTLELSIGVKVMSIAPATVVDEGFLAERGARIRAPAEGFEVYRIRLFELIAASRCAGFPVAEWFYRLQLLAQESRRKFEPKLKNAKGAAMARGSHRADAGIQEFAAKRQRSLQRAEQLRQEHAQSFDCTGKGKASGGGACPKLPLLPGKEMSTTGYRFWDAGPLRVAPELQGLGLGNALPLPRSFASKNVRVTKARSARKASDGNSLPKLNFRVRSEPNLRQPSKEGVT